MYGLNDGFDSFFDVNIAVDNVQYCQLVALG